MPPDTNGEGGEEVTAASEPRSLRWGEWVRAPRFVGGMAVALLGVLLVGLETLASGAMLPNTMGDQTVFVGVLSVGLGLVIALSGYRLSARQQQHLDQVAQARQEIHDYLGLLDDVALDEPESTWEIRSRLERARADLRKARRAAYRREYANFLALYYEASRQEILLYDLLDHRAGGWTFGLDIGSPPGADEEPESDRLRNLARRIRSYASDALPRSRRELVETYLGESDDHSPTPLDLYYAVRVLHEWNVSRYERATQVRRFLRGGLLVLVVVLVGLTAVLGLGFVDTGDGSGNTTGFLETVNDTSSNATSVQDDSVLLNDAFLGLVLLTGALGALFSMVYRSFGEFYSLTTDPSVPEPVFMLEALLARTLFGGVAALFLFLVARTDFAAVVLAADLLKNPLALLVLSFVAGFSERLVDETVSKVEGEVTSSRAPDDDRTGPSTRPGNPGEGPDEGDVEPVDSGADPSAVGEGDEPTGNDDENGRTADGPDGGASGGDGDDDDGGGERGDDEDEGAGTGGRSRDAS